MNDLTIKVSLRNERGKQNKKIRQNKWIPAVVYGYKQKNISFSLDIREAEKYSKKEYENKILTFDSKEKNLNGLKVIKKAISYHKVKHLPIHMDFLSLDMKKPIRVQVEIQFKGTPRGVKEEGGVFNTVLRSVEVECLPSDIPSSIDLDVSNLSINENMHVSDLKIPKNIKLIAKGERTLCTLVEAQEEEVVKTDEAATVSPEAESKDPEANKKPEEPAKAKTDKK